MIYAMPRRVLIVEDEASIRRGLADVLRFRGCEVEVAVDGAEGLQRGLREVWDLIVLDIMLPELNGFLVCERLREAGRETPVLMSPPRTTRTTSCAASKPAPTTT